MESFCLGTSRLSHLKNKGHSNAVSLQSFLLLKNAINYYYQQLSHVMCSKPSYPYPVQIDTQ